jgi:hypothetical protein
MLKQYKHKVQDITVTRHEGGEYYYDLENPKCMLPPILVEGDPNWRSLAALFKSDEYYGRRLLVLCRN